MTTIHKVQLIFDRDHGSENEGWYTRHTQYGVECDNALDATNPEDVEAALDEAVAFFGGTIQREDIEVVTN